MYISNATGCSSIWGGPAATSPYTVNKQGHGPAWSNSLFEDNAEHGMGMKLGYEAVNGMLAADAAVLVEAGAAAEAALREKAKREAAFVSTRTHAADDDSASIDDENIENSQTIGLAAVLEILGGRVIEEKMTEGGY